LMAAVCSLSEQALNAREAIHILAVHMPPSKLVLLHVFISGAVMVLFPCAGAWSNGGYSADPDNPDYGTHDWIADAALTYQEEDVTFLSETYHSLYLLGTEAPDNPDYIGDSVNHHVYYYSTGDVQDDVCAVRAAALYQTALDYMMAGELDKAAYDIGAMAHYVSDVGVFGHTMGTYTDWGAEVHHSDYEGEFESRLDTLSLPSGIALGSLDAYTATLQLAEAVTFGDGLIRPNIWMDTCYDWSDGAFVSSAMASLNSSVAAVASVINCLMIEATPPPPEPEPPLEPIPEPPEPLPSPEVPGPPASLTATVSGTSIILVWTPPLSDGGSELTGYVLLKGTSLGDFSELGSAPPDAHSWTDGSVEKGTTYYYRVIAENSVGEGEPSEVASAVVPEEPKESFFTIFLAGLFAACAAGGGALIWRKRTRGKTGY
jgi:hypothetical protein